MMDREDEDALREVLVSWYGPQAQGWLMNESMLNVVLKIIDEMRVCTDAMHFVPHPIGPGSALSQLAKSYIKKILAVARDNSKVYLTCSRATILRYKTEVHLASLGM